MATWTLLSLLGVGLILWAVFAPVGGGSEARDGQVSRSDSRSAGSAFPESAGRASSQGEMLGSGASSVQPSAGASAQGTSGRLTLTDAGGQVQVLDWKSPDAPGFIPTKAGEHYRVQVVWPYRDREVWATRMDGGTFDADGGMLLKIPVSDTGELDFGFVTGPEPGRYQIELAGASGGVEHIAFWADPPNLPVEPSGTTFVDPPLRNKTQP